MSNKIFDEEPRKNDSVAYPPAGAGYILQTISIYHNYKY